MQMTPEIRRKELSQIVQHLSSAIGFKFFTIIRALMGTELKKQDDLRRQLDSLRRGGNGIIHP